VTLRAVLRRQDGVSTLELGLLLPILLLLLTAVVPIVKAGWEYMVVSRASAHGIRYATRVDTNARMSDKNFLTRRPTATEVESFVRDAARPLQLTTVTVSPEPAGLLPGEIVTVRARYLVNFGPLGSLANNVKTALFGGGNLLPESTEITVSARGREE
jgi:hypothetical protein